MCGIAGIINDRGIKEKDRCLLETMSGCMKHRGPDGKGIFFDTKVGLAHRRLRIVDISDKGYQPMTYMDRYTVTFNGEIYNYIELKAVLSEKGYSFYSGSDTEVLLACYDYYGKDCVKMFNGMWAFMIYDNLCNTVFLSRDRYGVKPFHYYIGDGYALFASEVKALLCDGRIERIANDELIFDFLADSLLDHTNQTFFQNIYKVPPASIATIDLNKPIREVVFEQFYDVDFSKVDEKLRFEEAKEAFQHLFEDSIEKRLRSDVPVGTCLSGGLDSSAIVTAVYKAFLEKNKEQHTFSFLPDDEKISERGHIEEVLQGKDIVSHFVNDVDFKMEKEFLHLVDAQEEPFRTMSMFAGYLVYKAARKHGIIVLLDGQGADEILCGYRKARIYNIRQLVANRHYLAAAKEFFLSVSQAGTTSSMKADLEKVKKIFNRSGAYKSRYLKQDFLKAHVSKNIYGTGNFQNTDVKLISLPVLLRYVDRNSMAASVESRLPFLDYRFVDLCAAMPLSMKIKNGYSKYIMRNALDIPAPIKRERNKFGFAVPETMWIKKYGGFFKSFFEKGRFKADKYINRENVLKEWDNLVDGVDKNLLFRMISVAAWMERYDVHAV